MLRLHAVLIVLAMPRFVDGAEKPPPGPADAAKAVTTIVGHRGSSADRPENTLASYRRALEAGANIVEIDVRTTKDGVLVSMHDADVSRTTNGKGLIHELALANLQQLDAGSWFDPKYKGERVPTVRQILELCQGKAKILLDLKEDGPEYVARIIAEVRKHGTPKEIVVGVRTVEQARLFRRQLPEAQQLGLIPRASDIDAFAEAGVETIRLWPHWLNDPTLVPRVRKHNRQLHLGTNQGTKEEVLGLLSLGPESLSSDNPAQLIQSLAAIAREGATTSSYRIVAEAPTADMQSAELVVEVFEGGGNPLPARAIVTASDGSHPDGSGHGVYADGRFFADGTFSVRVPPGPTRVMLRGGPNFVPLDVTIPTRANRSTRIRAALLRWFAPEERNWFSGDNHIHAQHDAKAVVKTSLDYTARQARANGLSYVTEAGSAAAISYADMDKLNTKTFLLRQAQEIRPGPFIGHLNTPGIRMPIPADRLERALKRPLPVQAIAELAHDLGGVVIHTHPLTPPHLLHWMGAGEVYADAVLGTGADLLDIDSRQTELLWFSVLNLGHKLACSSYTDSALGRLQTLSPGDRRVYCHAKELTHPAIIEALRQGKTFATNGGPVFPFWTIDGWEPGDTLPLADRAYRARIELRSLYPLKTAQLIRRGNVVHDFGVAGKKGEVRLDHDLKETAASWYVLRVEDERGHWAITSPIYIESGKPALRDFASALVLEISNHTRFIQLRKEFYAHLIVTVRDDAIEEVELLKDGEVLRSFKATLGNQLSGGKVPTTEIDGEYGPGWLWHPNPERSNHFQADWLVTQTGWYSLRVRTSGRRVLTSDAIRYDAQAANSHALSSTKLEGADTRFQLWGYGEEMALADIRLPFSGDHWWYPAKTHWQIRAQFGGRVHELSGGSNPAAGKKFRAGR